MAGDLLDRKISILDGVRLAQDAILGTQRASGLPGRVLRSSSEVARDLSGLRSYIEQYSIDQPEKWAGTLLMLHVQLALGDVPSAVRLSKSVIQVSRGSCPPKARPFALAIVDSMLVQSGELTPSEVELFLHARDAFRGT